MTRKAFICGLSGLTLSADERRFLAREIPCGIILFARNAASPAQVSALAAEAREAAGNADLLVLTDQEGGRVQRLGPPHWPAYPPANRLRECYCREPSAAIASAFVLARLMAEDLQAVGINMNCAPVLDIPVPGASEVIGDRAYGTVPESVIALGKAVADGFLAGGVLPVIKHIPGHGRADCDSHFFLPAVKTPLSELEETDFKPFTALNTLPAAMTAHVVYNAIDPANPVTASQTAIGGIIRGAIGFDGLLMSDDISMRALSGSIAARTEAAFAAGCDVVLHCNGKMKEMEAVALQSPALTGKSLARLEAALARRRDATPFDRVKTKAMLAEFLGTQA